MILEIEDYICIPQPLFKMEKIIVFSQRYKEVDKPYIKELFDTLSTLPYEIFISEDFSNLIKNDIDLSQKNVLKKGEPCDAKVMITLGGDGTILTAAQWLNKVDIPIMGINLGRMGFLAFIEKLSIKKALLDWHEGRYIFQERALLQLDSKPYIFQDFPYGLNDFTILKKETSSMITIKTYIDGEFLNAYWADGLIVATPTGSTGYSLSCGGPIIFPNSGNFVITPIAPHNLNVRPIVIPDSSVISFELEGRTDAFLCTLDSRNETVTKEHSLTVKKSNFNITMVVLEGQSFMKTIRDKLSWGLDIRN